MLYEGSGQAYMHANAAQDEESEVDETQETRFPVPNETAMRTTKSKSSRQRKTQVVQYQGNGSTVGTPTDLPFSPPGLMWRGRPAITTSQLLSQRDELIASRSNNKAPVRRGRGKGH